MKRLCLLSAVVLVFFANTFSYADIIDIDVYSGSFNRLKGAPSSQRAGFSSLEGKAESAALKIINGSRNGSAAERVSSCVITLNGRTVADPSDFSRKVGFLEKEVSLSAGQNSLEVLLDGKPGSAVAVKIVQHHQNSPPVLDLISPIIVKEGETVRIDPTVTDPDNDPVTVAYSGWMTSAERVTGYTDSGSYNVTVTATDSHGASTSKDVQIIVENVNLPPVAVLKAGPDHGYSPLTVELDPSASFDPDGGIALVEIDFDGDGTYDWSSTDPQAKIAHLYKDPKVYTAALRVTDNEGASALGTAAIVVEPPPNSPPVIEPLDDITIKEGQTIVLKPIVYDPDGDEFDITYSGWMSSDTYTTSFDDAGTYTVTVTATDIHDASSSRDVVINVLDAPPYSPIGTLGLVSYWPLDGNWKDIWGGHDLQPQSPGGFSGSPYVKGFANQSYGPTNSTGANGATATSISGPSGSQGVTLEGWAFIPDNDSGGELFGFGTISDYNGAKATVSAYSGYVKVFVGQKGKCIVLTSSSRYSGKCWHHLALVIPSGFSTGKALKLYVDGQEADATCLISGSNYQADGTGITDAMMFSAPFKIGSFTGKSAGAMRVDEVRLWGRELSVEEISQLADATGEGEACDASEPPGGGSTVWVPPWPRCAPPQTLPAPRPDLGVRVLSDNTIEIVTDPNPWLKSRLASDCGTFLSAIEANRSKIPSWSYQLDYNFAAKETILTYRPGILEALDEHDGPQFTISSPGMDSALPVSSKVWPQATREFRVARASAEGGEIGTPSSENVYFSFARLDFSLEPGKTYTITDRWGNTVNLVYDEDATISWALKVDQVGYMPDAAEKYAYLGAWLGPAWGSMDLSRFSGKAFSLIRESDKATVFTGTITPRPLNSNDVKLSGETVYELDFSSFSTPGRYYIRVAGLGRSWSFEVGQNAMGEAFYTHARGLFHQRCGMDLTKDYTPWARGDNHLVTYKGGFPPDYPTDYQDHTAEGWGFSDGNGNFPTYGKWFDVVSYTATDQILPLVHGGWHDAADFDRRPYHFGVVSDLVHSYLMYPGNFTDAQLNIPESGNGIPDILDEAVWGMEVWREAQEADGRVGTWIETTSHPTEFDPGKDTQRYYLSLATRNSSLHYAAHAALLGRALVQVGAQAKGQEFIDSARSAYAFGTGSIRVSTSFKVGSAVHTWTEPALPDRARHIEALIQLWLATKDPAYWNEMQTSDMSSAFEKEVTDLHWRTEPFDLMDVALHEDLFPMKATKWGPTWGQSVKNRTIQLASDWISWQKADSYRKLWYPPDHGYFTSMGWGGSGFRHIRYLIAAFRITGDVQYRTGALLAVDWLQGANPQGRVNTTGLGRHSTTNPLHLPSEADSIADPVPGITIYGYTGSFPGPARTQVYGLFDSPRQDLKFSGSAMAQLPNPWDDPSMTTDDIGTVLYGYVPIWRRLITLEHTCVSQTEFTVFETISKAAAVTGCLMGEGWKPSAELKGRQPRSEGELRDSRWIQP